MILHDYECQDCGRFYEDVCFLKGDDITKTVEDVLSAINLAREIRQLVPSTSAIKIVSSLEDNDA